MSALQPLLLEHERERERIEAWREGYRNARGESAQYPSDEERAKAATLALAKFDTMLAAQDAAFAAPPAPQPSDAATSGGETVQQAGVAEPRNLFWPGCGEYVVLFRADYEPTMTDCYVYRGEDGHTWVRPATQMEDGRFKYAERRAEPRVMCLKCSTLVPESEADEHCERFHADAPEAAKE